MTAICIKIVDHLFMDILSNTAADSFKIKANQSFESIFYKIIACRYFACLEVLLAY